MQQRSRYTNVQLKSNGNQLDTYDCFFPNIKTKEEAGSLLSEKPDGTFLFFRIFKKKEGDQDLCVSYRENNTTQHQEMNLGTGGMIKLKNSRSPEQRLGHYLDTHFDYRKALIYEHMPAYEAVILKKEIVLDLIQFPWFKGGIERPIAEQFLNGPNFEKGILRIGSNGTLVHSKKIRQNNSGYEHDELLIMRELRPVLRNFTNDKEQVSRFIYTFLDRCQPLSLKQRCIQFIIKERLDWSNEKLPNELKDEIKSELK